MIRDLDKNEVILAEKPNKHILICGQSGHGKSYLNCRLLEDEFDSGHRCLVLDYSGSYVKSELEEHRFRYINETAISEPIKNRMIWECAYQDINMFAANLADALMEVLGITSYFQRKWMRRAINKYVRGNEFWTIPDFLQMLEKSHKLEVEANNVEDAANIERLLSRIEPYHSMTEFAIKNSSVLNHSGSRITIVQLSESPELEREFITSLLLGLMWKERRGAGGIKRYDSIFLDEFQHISLYEGATLYEMLREGRKTKLRIVLSSQYISNYDTDELSALLQVGNIIIFKPTENDDKSVARLIDADNVKNWREVVVNLNMGEVVIKGNYRVGAHSRVLKTPLICKVE